MKKVLSIALALILALSLVACAKSDAPSGGNTPSGNDTSNQPTSQGDGDTPAAPVDDAPSGDESGAFEIDLSQFTPRELPESEILEEWMKPEFGVITSGSEVMAGFYSFTVSGVSKANEESYRQLIESKGFAKATDFTYKKDGIEIALGTAAIENTKDSIMTVTIQKQ